MTRSRQASAASVSRGWTSAASTNMRAPLAPLALLAWCVSTGEGAVQYYGKFLGPLQSFYHGVSGDIYAVDARTLHIRDFSYDGEGPAAFFYVGNSKAPSSSGHRLLDEKGQPQPLKRYRRKSITLTLPEGKTLANVKWFSVYCDEARIDFGHVKVPKSLDFPKPQKIAPLAGVHAVSSEPVVVVDAQTLLVPSFSFDGEAPDAKFWVGRGPKPSPQGIRVPDENGKEVPLRRYDRKTIVLTLPGDLTVFEIGHFGVWCEAFTVDFGHIQVPAGLNVPPSLKMLGVAPQKRSRSLQLSALRQPTQQLERGQNKHQHHQQPQQPYDKQYNYHNVLPLFNVQETIRPTTYRPQLLVRPSTVDPRSLQGDHRFSQKQTDGYLPLGQQSKNEEVRDGRFLNFPPTRPLFLPRDPEGFGPGLRQRGHPQPQDPEGRFTDGLPGQPGPVQDPEGRFGGVFPSGPHLPSPDGRFVVGLPSHLQGSGVPLLQDPEGRFAEAGLRNGNLLDPRRPQQDLEGRFVDGFRGPQVPRPFSPAVQIVPSVSLNDDNALIPRDQFDLGPLHRQPFPDPALFQPYRQPFPAQEDPFAYQRPIRKEPARPPVNAPKPARNGGRSARQRTPGPRDEGSSRPAAQNEPFQIPLIPKGPGVSVSSAVLAEEFEQTFVGDRPQTPLKSKSQAQQSPQQNQRSPQKNQRTPQQNQRSPQQNQPLPQPPEVLTVPTFTNNGFFSTDFFQSVTPSVDRRPAAKALQPIPPFTQNPRGSFSRFVISSPSGISDSFVKY